MEYRLSSSEGGVPRQPDRVSLLVITRSVGINFERMYAASHTGHCGDCVCVR